MCTVVVRVTGYCVSLVSLEPKFQNVMKIDDMQRPFPDGLPSSMQLLNKMYSFSDGDGMMNYF